MNSAAAVQAVTPYVPHQTLLALLHHQGNALERRADTRGGVLFIDLAGFTPLSVTLGEMGALGLEKLQEIMMDYFT